MPRAIIISHKSSPIFKDVIRLKHTRAPIVNYAHACAVCTFLRGTHAKSLGTRLNEGSVSDILFELDLSFIWAEICDIIL